MPSLRQPSSAALQSAIAEAFPLSAPETRSALAASASVQSVTGDEIVINQGDTSWVALVLDGHAGLRRTTLDGRQLMSRILSHGDLAGVPSLARRPAGADVVALAECVVARWSAEDLRALAAADSGFALDALDQTLTAYVAVVGRSDGLVHQDAVVRVARVLYRYRDLFFADPPVLTRAHLPMIVGTSREMTGRVIRTLEARGIVTRSGRHGLRLQDPDGLGSLGGGPARGGPAGRPAGGSSASATRHATERISGGRGERSTITAGRGESTRPAQWAAFAPIALVEASPNPIVAVDSSGRITYANARAVNTFGYSRDELVGRPVEMLVPGRVSETHVRHRDGFLGHPVSRSMGIGLELTGRRKDGSEFPVEVSLAPVETSDGLQVFATVVDITARKAAESKLLQAQKLESIGRLAGGIAHDFNNMLFAISGYAEMLEQDLSPASNTSIDREAAIHSVSEISRAAARAASLTKQLLAFSRRQIVTPRVLDLGAAVIAIEPMLRPLIGETVRLALDLDPEAGFIRADPGQLDQILVNLVVNARDAMPDGGTITIETGNIVFDEPFAMEYFEVTPGPYVMLAVGDTGQGMDRETREHIFEPFFTTKEIGKGTGLGLATIYGIVHQAGGQIWLYSEPGLGSTFKLYFPRDAASPTPEPATPPVVAMGSGRLLVVEDEPAVRDMITTLLTRAGYEVTAVADATEALARAAKLPAPIDVLVTDVVMANMSGIELAEAMLQRTPDLGVVLLSGYTAERLDPSRLMAGGAIFVSKPIASRELLDAIGRAMAVRREP